MASLGTRVPSRTWASSSHVAAAAAAPRQSVAARACPGRALRSQAWGSRLHASLTRAAPGSSSSSSLVAVRPRGRAAPGRLVVRAAVFDQLTTNLEQVWTKLKSQDKLTRENVKEPMQDIRRALLEADVSLPVVRRFVKNVTDKAVGTEVIKGVRPDQQLVKVVNDELTMLMGGNVADIEYAPPGQGPTVVLMAGLQGVGKTTACGKLALFFKKRNKSCMLVATDIYRPAAIDQLHTLGQQVGVPVFSAGTDVAPPEIARRGVEEAKKQKVEVVIIDTAGRLQIDRGMMEELKSIKGKVNPKEVLLVVDAMTGQEAAGLVASFNAEVGITGAILTKLDGDSRGGAALSVKEVSGRPIKFVGEGEGMSALEPFYPERMASRILGMGDVLSLVEKAQELVAKEDAEAIQKKMLEAKFDFNDMLKQTRMIARMGSMAGMLKLMPGMSKITPQQIRDAEKNLRVMESMINSMTPEEREDPELLAKNPSRRRRISRGSGRTQEQVSGMVGQLFQMRVQMKAMAEMMSGKTMNIPGLDTSGQKKASPGTAKRKKSRTGFAKEVAAASAGAGQGSRGFGSRK